MARSDGGGRRVLVPAVAGLLAVVLVALGALVAALWLPARVPPMVAPQTGPVSVAVSSQSYDGAHMVAASLQLGQAKVLHSPASGLVTASSCAVGADVTSGSSPLSVNGVPVLALATAVPLWRDLGLGAQGGDVAGLQAELNRLGHAAPSSGVFDSDTAAVVQVVLAGVGAGLVNGVLPASEVMWLPIPQITVGACSVQVGDQVGAGQEFAKSSGLLNGLVLANPPGDGWVAKYAQASAVPDAKGAITDVAFLAAVEAGPDFAFATGPNGQNQIQLNVTLATTLTVIAVPPGAVIVAGQGKGCVVSGGQVIPVSIVSSSLGKTMVTVVSGATPVQVDAQPDRAIRCA